MARYLIERDFGQISEEEMQAAARRSKSVAAERFPEVVWEHSHVCTDESGAVVSFCVYRAPGPDAIRAHADAFGAHVIARIYEIAEDVAPADVPPA